MASDFDSETALIAQDTRKPYPEVRFQALGLLNGRLHLLVFTETTPTKVRVSMRLSPDVVETFRATGDGWQTRIDHALKDWLETHTPA